MRKKCARSEERILENLGIFPKRKEVPLWFSHFLKSHGGIHPDSSSWGTRDPFPVSSTTVRAYRLRRGVPCTFPWGGNHRKKFFSTSHPRTQASDENFCLYRPSKLSENWFPDKLGKKLCFLKQMNVVIGRKKSSDVYYYHKNYGLDMQAGQNQIKCRKYPEKWERNAREAREFLKIWTFLLHFPMRKGGYPYDF